MELDALHVHVDESGYWGALDVQRKLDDTMVTKLDKDLSLETEKFLREEGLLKDAQFLCEENLGSHTQAKENLVSTLPSYILDPVDGTRGLISGLPEWCYSLAFLQTPLAEAKENEAWIFNPMTGFSIKHEDVRQKPPHFPLPPKPWLGLVSRSEWNKGMIPPPNVQDLTLSPRGSIALKLGMLAAGGCDFVFSQKPKSLWDIAAGTILCAQRGLKMYNKDGPIDELTELRYAGPLLWCDPLAYEELSTFLFQD